MKKLKIIITAIDIDRWYDANAQIFDSAYKSYPGYVYDINHNYWKDAYPEGLAEATYDSPGGWLARRPTRGFGILEGRGWSSPSVNKPIWNDQDFQNYNTNFNTLVNIIKMCKEANIVLIGVITPQNPRYKETEFFGKYGVSRNDAPARIQEIADLQDTYPNFILMDENKMGDHDYTDDMAYDRDHLAEKGAEQLTSRINALIQTLNIDFTP